MKKIKIPISIKKTIAYIKIIILCFTLLIVFSCSKNSDFYLLDGSDKDLGDYRGQWLIINFWAKWCSPCLEEIPELNRLHEKAALYNLAIIGISYDPLDNHQIKSIVDQWNINYPVVATQPIPHFPFKLPKSLPSNYILDPNGQLVAQISGKQDVQSLTKLLKRLEKQFKRSQ